MYTDLSNSDLLAAEYKLPYKDPDLWAEIFRRAEEIEPGITARYNNAVANDSPELPDDVFNRAAALLTE